MTDRDVMQQALEALASYSIGERLDASQVNDLIAELDAALEQQAEPPPEWEVINNIIAEYGLQAIDFVADWKATLEQAEPVAFYCPSKGFYWAKSIKVTAPTIVGVPPMALYTTPAQRPWQGLKDDDWEQIHDRKDTALDTFAQGAVWAQTRLMERNR